MIAKGKDKDKQYTIYTYNIHIQYTNILTFGICQNNDTSFVGLGGSVTDIKPFSAYEYMLSSSSVILCKKRRDDDV